MKNKVGDIIKIVSMKDEPSYTGKVGRIEIIDDANQLHGTWGGLAVNLKVDSIENFKKPVAKMIGKDGNVFNLMGLAAKELERANQKEKASEMSKRIWDEAKSYSHALEIISEYVEIY